MHYITSFHLSIRNLLTQLHKVPPPVGRLHILMEAWGGNGKSYLDQNNDEIINCNLQKRKKTPF
jgi:hypothetical protein